MHIKWQVVFLFLAAIAHVTNLDEEEYQTNYSKNDEQEPFDLEAHDE